MKDQSGRAARSPGNEHGRENRNKNPLKIVDAEPPVVKKLLDNYGTCWLFEVCQGQHLTYQVEREERCWVFNLLHQARVKFKREAAGQGRGRNE